MIVSFAFVNSMVAGRGFVGLCLEATARPMPRPDGLRVTGDGTVLTAALHGVLVMDSTGKRLGLFRTGSRIANCAFGDDGKTMCMTSEDPLPRIRLKVDAR